MILFPVSKLGYSVAMQQTDIVDRIYEAAFVPECWPSLLERIAHGAQSASGALIVFEDVQPVRFAATPVIRPWTDRFCKEQWKVSNRIPHIRRNPMRGFTVLSRYFGREFMVRDTSHVHRLALGLESEAGAAICMPTGDVVVFSFDKKAGTGPHTKEAVHFLNGLHPHLARAGLIAARLAVERAAATTSTLQMIGLPAAVLSCSGRVIATNPLFESLGAVFHSAAFGRLRVADARSNIFIDRGIKLLADRAGPLVRSVPVTTSDGKTGYVLHLVPLRGAAVDVFPGGAVVLTVTAPKRVGQAPCEDILRALFDLTSSEARFAIALASGLSPRRAAQQMGITESSGRTYLARIFMKTGTHRQSELLTLLQSTQPFAAENGSNPAATNDFAGGAKPKN